jgi:16S rRNA (adenine1518-N6/adenine1519-N6)-dimethyltransferase
MRFHKPGTGHARTTAAFPPRRKALGQHHLRDESLCRPAVEYLARNAPTAAPVVEIGPGGGVLTSALLRAGHPVLALELDPKWAFHLRQTARHGDWVGRQDLGTLASETTPPASRLRLAVGDALAVDWTRLPRAAVLAGNLPYQIATALIEDLLDAAPNGTVAAFLVQREVAERLVAAPSTPAYGSFSVLVQARCRIEVLARVRAGSFVPPPKVESAFVGLRFGPAAVAPNEWPAFKETVRAAFGARRKTLRNSLAATWGREVAAALLRDAGIAGEVRAEALDLAAFVRLFESRRHSKED